MPSKRHIERSRILVHDGGVLCSLTEEILKDSNSIFKPLTTQINHRRT